MPLTIVFFGSPPEAVESLSVLRTEEFEVVSVYTRPDRPAGRGNRMTPTAVKVWASERGLDIRTPDDLRSRDTLDHLASTHASIFVVAAYGRILPPAVLDIPRLGVVNIHPSLLPRYRGPSPVQTAILDGVSETGVTIMKLDEGMDTGMILRASGPVPLNGTERAGELMTRMFSLGAKMLPDVLLDLSSGQLTPVPQDDSLASVTKMVRRSNGAVDWRRPARHLERMMRAYEPWPGIFTTWHARTLKILDAGGGGMRTGRKASGHGISIWRQARGLHRRGDARSTAGKTPRQACSRRPRLLTRPSRDRGRRAAFVVR